MFYINTTLHRRFEFWILGCRYFWDTLYSSIRWPSPDSKAKMKIILFIIAGMKIQDPLVNIDSLPLSSVDSVVWIPCWKTKSEPQLQFKLKQIGISTKEKEIGCNNVVSVFSWKTKTTNSFVPGQDSKSDGTRVLLTISCYYMFKNDNRQQRYVSVLLLYIIGTPNSKPQKQWVCKRTRRSLNITVR